MKNYFEFLRQLIKTRIQHFPEKGESSMTIQLPVSELNSDYLSKWIRDFAFDYDETVVLLLALVPHLDPDFLTQIIKEEVPADHDFPIFGGVRSQHHRGILPTGETAQFILAGSDLEKRIRIQQLFSPDHWFSKEHFLWLEHVHEGEPQMSGRIILDPEIVELLTVGKISKPVFSSQFPAELLETEMSWDDLVLPPTTINQIREIENWIRYSDTLMEDWNFKRKHKPGFRVLFHGPPGTGKTLAATLLGKHTGQDVFRIDLSRVASKYIGETEKNLASLFAKAEHKNWILFFDEADALFGKRTDVRDAHDKFANQEVSYLLQRVESYNGLIILSSNQKSNIDTAFTRRFQSMVHFPIPAPEQRHQLWIKSMPSQIMLSREIDLEAISRQYELTGASIMNVIQHYSIEVLANNDNQLSWKVLESAIMREYVKEGKVL